MSTMFLYWLGQEQTAAARAVCGLAVQLVAVLRESCAAVAGGRVSGV